MKISNEEPMQLYKVKKLEDNTTINIIAIDFNDLQKDLIENEIEPIEIIAGEEVFITNGILKNN